MFHLYRWGSSSQYHYVVAEGYGEAERLIKDEYGWAHEVAQLEDLGTYVTLPKRLALAKAGK